MLVYRSVRSFSRRAKLNLRFAGDTILPEITDEVGEKFVVVEAAHGLMVCIPLIQAKPPWEGFFEGF